MDPFLNEKERPKTVKRLQELQLIADELGSTLPYLAIALIIRNPDVSTIILGASKSEQIDSNVKSL